MVDFFQALLEQSLAGSRPYYFYRRLKLWSGVYIQFPLCIKKKKKKKGAFFSPIAISLPLSELKHFQPFQATQ